MISFTASVDNGYENQVQLGDIQIELDLENDIVYGQIDAPWLSDPLPVTCSIWNVDDGPSIDLIMPPDPGSYTATLVTSGGILAQVRPWLSAILDPDNGRVYNTFEWPVLRAQIGPASNGDRHIWGHNAGANATVTVTVETDLGGFVAETIVVADEWGNFDTGQELPEGSLAIWNWVNISSSNGLTAAMQIYPMDGIADIDTDVVTVTAAGPPFFTINLEYCQPGWCGYYDTGDIGEDGMVSVDLMAESGFDVRPGTDYQAMLDTRDGNFVYYMWQLTAPDLGVWKWNSNGYARPDGTVVYTIQYRNDGNEPAENATIVDTIPAFTSYFDDTSGLPVTIGPGNIITWDLGTVDPGEDVHFTVALHVDPGAPNGSGVIDPNCVSIQTTTEGDTNPDNDSQCTGPVDVWDDEVELSVDKWSGPNDPTPGHEFEYYIRWCNNRGAAAGPVVITDTLPTGVSLLDWWTDSNPYWSELSFDGSELVFYAPALPGDRCETVDMRMLLDSSATISTTLVNEVFLDVAGDVNPGNNWYADENTHVSPPRYDLQVSKNLNNGVWTPGGFAGFSIDWHNNGNIATTVRITDTLPPGMSYSQGWWAGYTPWPNEPLPDPAIIGNQLVWDFPKIPFGTGQGINFELSIDEGVTPVPELVNCALVGAEGPDDNPDNESCVSLPVNPSGPNLQADKWHDWNGNGQLGYRINFRNIGDEPINDVWLVDTLPGQTQWNGWWDMNFDWNRFNGDIVDNGGQLLWNFTDLQPGDWGEIDFQVNIDNPGEPMVWYTNTVEISIPAGDTDTSDNIFEDVAFSGPEIEWVDLDVGNNALWGRTAGRSCYHHHRLRAGLPRWRRY